MVHLERLSLVPSQEAHLVEVEIPSSGYYNLAVALVLAAASKTAVAPVVAQTEAVAADLSEQVRHTRGQEMSPEKLPLQAEENNQRAWGSWPPLEKEAQEGEQASDFVPLT